MIEWALRCTLICLSHRLEIQPEWSSNSTISVYVCVCGLVSTGSETEGESDEGGLFGDLWARLVKRVLRLWLQTPTQSALHQRRTPQIGRRKERNRQKSATIYSSPWHSPPCPRANIDPPPPSLVILHLYCSLACRMSLLFRSAEPMWCWLMEYYSHKWDLQKGIKILGADMTESTEVKEVIGMFGCGKSMQEFCLLSFASHRGHECQGSHARTRLWSSVCPDAAPESRESMDIPRTDRQSGKQY